MIAVVDLDGGKASEVGIKQIDLRIVPGGICTSQSGLAKPFQNGPREKLVVFGVALDGVIL